MILQTPPVMAEIHTTYVMNNDQRSEVDKCLEGDYGLSDLLQKKIRNETFTEEDSIRITECIENRRRSFRKSATVFAIAVAVILVAGLIACFVV